jgi:hypothetical protein
MKKMVFVAFAALLNVGCSDYTKHEKETITDTFPQEMEYTLTREDTLTAMFNAFVMQESKGDVLAVSPYGMYVGCLQISKIMVREANRLIGDSIYSYNDRLDPDCCLGMFMAVMNGRNPNLDIDRAIDLWNIRCPDDYRNNVKTYYNENLSHIKSMK